MWCSRSPDGAPVTFLDFNLLIRMTLFRFFKAGIKFWRIIPAYIKRRKCNTFKIPSVSCREACYCLNMKCVKSSSQYYLNYTCLLSTTFPVFLLGLGPSREVEKSSKNVLNIWLRFRPSKNSVNIGFIFSSENLVYLPKLLHKSLFLMHEASAQL